MSYVGFCPPGVILPYAGSTAPEGWLLCDGSAISQTTYPALFAAIGSAYNTQVDPTTNASYSAPAVGLFRLPDYRASFLRGVGTPFAGDAVTLGGFQSHKTAKNGLTSSSAGASANHTHTVNHGHGINIGATQSGSGQFIDTTSYFAGGTSIQNEAYGTNTYSYTKYTYISSETPTSSSNSVDHSHSITVGAGDTETRPHNKGVNYIIKI